MSNGLNEVTLFGNLGADPELFNGNGGSVLKLRLATSETYLDKNNVKQEKTEWHSVAVFGKRADGLSKVLHKGDKVLIKGSIRTSSYDKDGEKRYRTEIAAKDVILAGGPRGGSFQDEAVTPDFE